jgi:uncharacterized protein (TIGR02646 family)
VRRIVDQQPPAELINWTAQQRAAEIYFNFETLGRVVISEEERDVKAAILSQRLKDQGYLCAYTLRRISENTAHLEHIIPRTVSYAANRPEETVTYRNIVACFPKNGGDTSHGYGAPVRKDLPLAVSPCEEDCERAFHYQRNGKVEPGLTPEHSQYEPVRKEIEETLCLNADFLVRARKDAIKRAGVSTVDDLNAIESPDAAERLARQILSFKRGNELTPFCVAISHAALAHAEALRKLRNRRAYARRQQQN